MLNLHAIQIFLEAAEHKSFSEAGRRMNLSQPAVSMQIRSLEQMVGMGLFDRSGSHIVLTEDGQAFIPMARSLLNQAIQVEESMESLQGEVVGLLKVGCCPVVARCILPGLLARLRQAYPQIHVNCNVTSRTLALQMLVDSEVHVAFTSQCVPHKNIEYRAFLTDRIILVAPPDHPWAHGDRSIELDELTQGPIILHEEESSTRSALSNVLASHNLSSNDLNVVMTLDSVEAICMAVQEGIGLAFVSHMAAAEALDAGLLAHIEVENMNLSRTIYAARHTDHVAARAQDVFWDLAFAPETETVRQCQKSRSPNKTV